MVDFDRKVVKFGQYTIEPRPSPATAMNDWHRDIVGFLSQRSVRR